MLPDSAMMANPPFLENNLPPDTRGPKEVGVIETSKLALAGQDLGLSRDGKGSAMADQELTKNRSSAR